MDDHHVSGDPFHARPPTSVQRVAGPPQPPRVVANSSTVPALTVRTPAPAAGFYEEDEPVEEVVRAYEQGEKTVTADPARTTAEPRHIPRSQLYAMRLTDLQAHARALGLDDTGKRPALIARIKAHSDTTEARAGEPDVVDP